ncbi:MAG: DUF4215 domain-containing protein [Thermodesulfobacteriota bacterium]
MPSDSRLLVKLSFHVLTAVAAASPATATVPADLCTGDPCVVTQALTVDAGSTLDFGPGTELRLAPSAALTVGAGGDRSITLAAGSIVLQPGAAILGGGDFATVTLRATAGALDLQRSGPTVARVDVSGNQAGSIVVEASGDVTIAGDLDARGSGRDSQGGGIQIDAGGTVAGAGGLLASATGNGAAGGGIEIVAGTGIALSGTLATSGGSFGGGEILLSTATGDLSLAGTINVSGSNPDGSAGGLEAVAQAGDVALAAAFTGTGGSGAQEACGDGAVILLDAAGDVSFGGAIDVTSGTHCLGGELTAVAGGEVRQPAGATFKSVGPGLFGGGGRVAIDAGTRVVLRSLDLSSGGSGGSLEAVAVDEIDVRGLVDASASGAEGVGGTTLLQACHVSVAAGGTLDARGSFVIPDFGVNQLLASGTMTVAGTLRAATANVLRHKGTPPIVTGTVVPAATITVDTSLPDCPPVPECGNAFTDVGEACDDGNTESCDGCSADCMRVDAVCGDTVRECGEQCDDGDVEDGDGCQADCTLTPPEGVRVRGTPLATAGCLAQWALRLPSPALDPSTGLPASRQACSDGDPACDADGAVDGACTFDLQVCTNVPDPEVPACAPENVNLLAIVQPKPPGGDDPVDQGNATELAGALMSLGVKVKAGTTVLRTGSPITAPDACTDGMLLHVPHLPGAPGERTFRISARAKGAAKMKKNVLTLVCETAAPACGDGVLQAGEACDDGNTDACDGCSAACTVEGCGNGVLECTEECDEGEANGGGEAACSSTCERLTPELRIPGGGAQRFDCAFEWSALAGPGDVPVDRKGVPQPTFTCTDDDPACDLDPQQGTCRVRLWGCFGGADARLGCDALQTTGAVVRSPAASAARAPEIAARAALADALAVLDFPAGPGERCTDPIELELPVRQAWLHLKLEVPIASAAYRDRDGLRIKCARP